MSYLILKSLHLVFVVTWFAGLFYIGRLFIYHREAGRKEETGTKLLTDQLQLMTRRLLFIICVPSMFLVIAFGLALIFSNPEVLIGWMHLKLLLVFGLVAYQFVCINLYMKMKAGTLTWTLLQLRLWNEMATLFLFAIVFLAVMKSAVNMFIGLAVMVGLAIFLWLGIKLYQYLGR